MKNVVFQYWKYTGNERRNIKRKRKNIFLKKNVFFLFLLLLLLLSILILFRILGDSFVMSERNSVKIKNFSFFLLPREREGGEGSGWNLTGNVEYSVAFLNNFFYLRFFSPFLLFEVFCCCSLGSEFVENFMFFFLPAVFAQTRELFSFFTFCILYCCFSHLLIFVLFLFSFHTDSRHFHSWRSRSWHSCKHDIIGLF